MPQPRIVATGPMDQVAVDILKPHGQIVITSDGREESLISLLDQTVAIVVRGDGSVSARVIESAAQLKVIGRSGVGYDNVDIAAATARKIPVIYTPGAGARAVAEASMALMLALCKNLAYWDRQLKAGCWRSRYESTTADLDGATLGVVGFGRIGQILAELASPFNMTILAHDPFVSDDCARQFQASLVSLDELLRRADFICLHAALTEQTRGLINCASLKLVKRGAYLINLARGGIIESLDVVHEALRDGRLAGVGLDVFAPEPPDVNHPIFKMPNCLATPHVLGMSHRAMERIFTSMAKDVAAVLSGRRPEFVVNPQVFT